VELVKASYIAIGLLAGAAGAQAATEPPRPNVIVIVADDLGFGDLGAYGQTRIRTPNIDRLAANGLRATQAYTSANVCSSSRAGLMTGRYAIRTGLAWKVLSAHDTRALPDSEETLAELAKRGGYATMYIGKWHLGTLPDHSPLAHGFDHFFGVPHSNDMPEFTLYDDAKRIEETLDQRTLTTRYTQKAVEFVSRESAHPFLLVVAHTFPHIPLYASERFLGKSAAGRYGDTVEELDWSTGEIMRALRNAKISRNTLVIFTSDNGPFFEGSTAGLKGGKGNSWEGGYRVPFIASWPAVIKKHRTVRSMTMNIDVLPTIAEAIGVQPHAEVLDGRSLMPLFRGADKSAHEYLYFFNNETVVGLRSPEWKLVTHAYYTGSLGAFEKFDQLPGFQSSYELLLDANGIDGEAYNMADRYPQIMTSLRRELHRVRAQLYPLRTHAPEPTYPE